MEGGLWATVLGTVAGICSTVSFVPQVIKAWREPDIGAISKRMYVAGLVAYCLWIVHGVMIASLPVMLFNGLNVVFSGAILILKLRAQRTAEQR